MRRDQSKVCRAFPTRLQLLVGFSVLVAIFIAGLAFGVGQLLRQSIREAALSGAEQTGRLFAELEVGHEEYANGELTATARRDLGVVVELSSTLLQAQVWGSDRELLYTSAPGRPSTPPADALDAAFKGEIGSGSSSGDRQSVLNIYVPIALAKDQAPRNVLELHLPYAPVQAEIDRKTKSLALVLGLAALLFYLALLPTVWRGSRALADLYFARQIPLQRRLRKAMRGGELALVYQPKLDLRSGRIEGVEALLRWRLGEGRTVQPGEFIPAVEPTAIMDSLTGHVFELALRQAAAWIREGIDLDIAVNISARNLSDEGLASRFAQRAAAYGVSPERFTLEITESAMSERPDRDLKTLIELRDQGFNLSIDDFGKGESSLSRIHQSEFQEVKIDRTFIADLDQRGDPVVVTGIIHLAQALGARVVGEGVESAATAQLLEQLGCDVIQGFHLARPVPPEELVEWLRTFAAKQAAADDRVPATIS